MNHAKRVLIGLASIFAAGAAVGALYAPDKGERTRRRIARKTRWLFPAPQDKIEEREDNLQILSDRIKDDLEKVNEEIDRLKKSH